MDAARGPTPTVPGRARPLEGVGRPRRVGPPPERVPCPRPVLSSAEDWPSGLRRTIGNRVGVTPSRVRIPYPPPADHDAGSTTGGPGVRVPGARPAFMLIARSVGGADAGSSPTVPMNLMHRRLCSSADWATKEAQRMPGDLADADLGDDVLEIG